MNDLISWLRTQLDTDERVALAADHDHRWEAIRGRYAPVVRTGPTGDDEWTREIGYAVWSCDDEQDGCPDAARSAMAEAVHIANNDPARVLRQVQAHRAILDALAAAQARSKAEWRNYARWIEGKGDKPVPVGPPEDSIAGLEIAVRALVSIYSDRDGYKEEWSA